MNFVLNQAQFDLVVRTLMKYPADQVFNVLLELEAVAKNAKEATAAPKAVENGAEATTH